MKNSGSNKKKKLINHLDELLNVHIPALLDDEQKEKVKIKANQFGGVPGVTAMIYTNEKKNEASFSFSFTFVGFYLSYCLTQNHGGTFLFIFLNILLIYMYN